MAKSSLSARAHAHKATPELWEVNSEKARRFAGALVRQFPYLRPHQEDIEAKIASTSTMRGIVAGPHQYRNAMRDFCNPSLRFKSGQSSQVVKFEAVNSPHNVNNLRSHSLSSSADFEFLELVTIVADSIENPRLRLWFRLVALEGLNITEASEAIGVSRVTGTSYARQLREVISSVS